MAITQTIHLTQHQREPFPIMDAVQNDTGRSLKMILDDVTLTSGNTGELYFKRSDDSFYHVSATLATGDNSFTADITQGLTQPGTTECQLKVTASSKAVSTFTFLIRVQPAVDGMPSEQLGVSVDDLLAMLERMEAADDEVQQIVMGDAIPLGPRAANTDSGYYSIEIGGIGADGTNYNIPERARTGYIGFVNTARVRLTDIDTYVIWRVHTYTSNNQSTGIKQWVIDEENGAPLNGVVLDADGGGTYFRVVFKANDDREMTDADLAAIQQKFIVEKPTDLTFTLPDVAADAQAVGKEALIGRGTITSGLLKDHNERGLYYIGPEYIPSDAPENKPGRMLVLSSTSSAYYLYAFVQIYFCDSGHFWFRYNSSSVERPDFVWHKVSDSDDIYDQIAQIGMYQLDVSQLTFSYGGIRYDGYNTDYDTRIRYRSSPTGAGAFRAGAGSTIAANTGYKFNVAVYDWYVNSQNFKLRSYRTISADPFTLESDGFIRVGIGTTNDDVLWTEDSDGVKTYTAAGIAAQEGLEMTIYDKTVKDELADLEDRGLDPFESVFPLDDIPLNALDYHAKYDDLVNDGWLTRTLLGNADDDSDYPVYMYTLRSDMNHINPSYSIVSWDGSNELYERPKVFISSGLHGNERTTPYALYAFINNLCNNVSFADMRNAFDWYFVPLCNPWGFSHTAMLNGVEQNGSGTPLTDYTIIDNTTTNHRGIRYNADGVDINRDFDDEDGFVTAEAQFVRTALTTVYGDGRKCVFAMDMHQAAVGSRVNAIGAFLSLNYDATADQKDFVYGKWMQAGAKTENIMAAYCDVDNRQSVYTWDGTNLATLRNYLAAYADIATCFEGGETLIYYSGTSEWSNSIARAFVNTQLQIFMKQLLGEGTALATSSGGESGGLTDDVKQALLNCFEHVAWTDEYGQDYVDALEAALYPPANLVRITAVYTQSGTVYDTDSLDSLKTDLVVTATYSDSSSETVASADYTLSGTLTVGTSTITVSYGGKTTTFTVTVTSEREWEDGVPYSASAYQPVVENVYWNNGVETSYNGWNRTAFVNCYQASSITFDRLTGYSGLPDGTYSVFVNRNGQFLSTLAANKDAEQSTTNYHKVFNVPEGAFAFSISEGAAQITRFIDGTYKVTPNE